MPFFSSLFSSSKTKENNKKSHFNRFVSNVTKPAQYQPDIYDDLRDEGSHFRPSDTLRPTPAAGQAGTMPYSSASAIKSTPHLYAESPNAIVRRPTTGYRHSPEARDSGVSFSSYSNNGSRDSPAELEVITLPATVYTPPAKYPLGSLSARHATSTPCLPASTNSMIAELPALPVTAENNSSRRKAMTISGNDHRQPRTSSLPRSASTPFKPSPLHLVTAESETLISDDDEEYPIILSPRTAASLSPPTNSNNAERFIQTSTSRLSTSSYIKRKPLPPTPVFLLPQTTYTMPETVVQVAPAELSGQPSPALPSLSQPSPKLPDLPGHLSRLQTLRQRLSLVHPAGLVAEAMPEKEVVNPGLGMYHHNFSAIELSALTESGTRARGKRSAFADQPRPVSLPNNLAELDASRADAVTMLATTIEPAHCGDLPETGNDIELANCASNGTSLDVQDGDYDGDDESDSEDEHDVIEVGTAKSSLESRDYTGRPGVPCGTSSASLQPG